MPFTTQETTILPLRSLVKNLAHILQKAAWTHPDKDALLKASLSDGATSLELHVRNAIDFAENIITSLIDRNPIVMGAVPLRTWADFDARLHELAELLTRMCGPSMAGLMSDSNPSTQTANGPRTRGRWLHSVSLPHMYLHVVSVYSILEKEGIVIEVIDWDWEFLGMNDDN